MRAIAPITVANTVLLAGCVVLCAVLGWRPIRRPVFQRDASAGDSSQQRGRLSIHVDNSVLASNGDEPPSYRLVRVDRLIMCHIRVNCDSFCVACCALVVPFSLCNASLSLCDDCNACFFVNSGQLRWAFAYSGSLPLYLLIHNNMFLVHFENKKHLKNVGSIRHCEPPHALILHCHSLGVATVARRLRIVSTTTTTTTTTTRDRGDRYGPIEWPNKLSLSLSLSLSVCLC